MYLFFPTDVIGNKNKITVPILSPFRETFRDGLLKILQKYLFLVYCIFFSFSLQFTEKGTGLSLCFGFRKYSIPFEFQIQLQNPIG